jgi:hypothetical protein
MTAEERNNYLRIHEWLRNSFGLANHCDQCNNISPKRFEWALRIGYKYEYKKENYIQLCPSCHRKYDETTKSRRNRSKIKIGKEPNNIRSISQYNKEGKLINQYRSISIASQKTGISRTAIMNVLSGISKIAGFFIWKYN